MKNYGIFKATEEICTNNVERDRLMTCEDLWSVVDRYIVYEAGTCKEIFRSRSRKEAEDFIEDAEADDSDSCLDMREERE